MVAFSIFDELLGTPHCPLEPGATSLISRLLEVAAHEATESDTNIQTCYSIVKTAREKREEIDDALKNLAEGDPVDNAWETFTQAIQDIRDLEKLVLDIGILKPPSQIDLESTTVEMASTHLRTWEDRRTALGEGYRLVAKFAAKPETNVNDAQRQDDISILQTLVGRITSGEDSAIKCLELVGAHNALKDHMDGASRESGLDSQRVLYAIKAAWLVNSATVEAKEAKGKRQLGLNDNILWKRGLDFVMNIPDMEEAELEVKYNEFLRMLLNNEQDAPLQTIIKLIVASRKITRPFLSRNETLLKHCWLLTQAYNIDSDSVHKVQNQGSVKLAIDESYKAVEAAARCLPATGTLDIEQKVFQDADNAYKAAQIKVKEVLNKYSPTDAAALDQKMEIATKEDDDRMTMLKKRCANTSARTATARKVKIIVSSTEREYMGDTKIAALIWDEKAKTGKQIVGMRQDGKLLEAHATVMSLDPSKELEFVQAT